MVDNCRLNMSLIFDIDGYWYRAILFNCFRVFGAANERIELVIGGWALFQRASRVPPRYPEAPVMRMLWDMITAVDAV